MIDNLQTPDIAVPLRPGLFTVDDVHTYPGYHDTAHEWNGWRHPYFTAEVLLHVVEQENRLHAEAGHDYYLALTPRRDGYTVSEYEDGKTYDHEEICVGRVAGSLIYSFLGGVYAWREVTGV